MFVYPKRYDVIVIGAGHAGIEAALASARIGCETMLLTINADSIGQMSCNPAIGGLAKGHLVREIDALGGQMGQTTDYSGIQFRMLNTRNGPSVWAPRAQCDKKTYQFKQKWICEIQARLDIQQGICEKILEKDKVAFGIQTKLGVQYYGKTIIITTGTFLTGLIHIGPKQQPGGRSGEHSSISLSSSLRSLGIDMGRLKTGTPPRILGKSINFQKTEPQYGDEPIPFFSFWEDNLFHVEQEKKQPNHALSKYNYQPILNRIGGQIPCFITKTTKKTKEIVLQNIHKSAMYSGQIAGVGPRYCPSIEDKFIRFTEKEGHQIFLEPEGCETDEYYINGLSTSLPYEIQINLVRSVIGCDNAQIIRPAYAVEYDFAFPTQINSSLESKVCQNLYFAGQINGTSGYEEAASQGIIAGINAARRVLNKPPIVLHRDQAYIGVLIDDLTTKGTSEPYRMFTSRAEHRLLLRQDNANMRLSDIGYEVGLLPLKHYEKFKKIESEILKELNILKSVFIGKNSLAKLLARPEVAYKDLPHPNPVLDERVRRQVEIEVKYAGYIERQEADVIRSKSLEGKTIPDFVDYSQIASLRLEARQKLGQIRPRTIGQAGRISGVSPADISVLLVYLRNGAKP